MTPAAAPAGDELRDRLHGTLRDAARAALDALEPAALVRGALGAGGDALRSVSALPPRVHVLAVGKAADGMATGACAALGARVAGGLVIAPAGSPSPGIEPSRGGPALERVTARHPVPDASSAAAGHAALRLLGSVGEGEALLVLLSGGASSLMVNPAPGLTLDDLALTNTALLAAPLSIGQVNAVRKRIDHAKGGRLAAATAARTIVVLAISDVVGDRLDVIGSGPFHPDASTVTDAVAALRRAGTWAALPTAVRDVLEAGRPAVNDPHTFERVRHYVIANNATARAAAVATLSAAGYAVEDYATPLTGAADAAGAWLAARARALGPGHALVAGGETVVHVTGSGRGGRNQQLALSAALALDGAPDIAIAAIATDGVDGPTDAAGAIVDGATVARIRAAGLDAAAALHRNDAYPALAAAGALLITGPTGTNVADIQFALRRHA